MANYSSVPRPAYVWDGVNNQWVPIGVGAHTHAVGDTTNLVSTINTAVTTLGVPVSTVTAKGDHIVATGSGAVTNLPVGADGSVLTANSAATTGMSWAGPLFTAGKNKIINGDFGIWQRGTSFSGSSNQYTADRWFVVCATGQSAAVSQQAFTPGSAPVAGYESSYYTNIAWSSWTTNTYWFTQKIENVQSFAGQTVTLSFWAKASSATSVFNSYIEQNFGSGGSGTAGSSNYTLNLTTSWQRFSFTYAIPSIAGKTVGTGSYLDVRPLNSGSSSNGITVSIWGVQLEAGSVATPFQTATGTLQGELAACQRYYWRFYGNASTTSPIASAYLKDSTDAQGYIQYPVTMRTAPTASYSAAADVRVVWSAGTSATSAINQDLSTPYGTLLRLVTTGLTTGQGGFFIVDTGASKYLDFSAEL